MIKEESNGSGSQRQEVFTAIEACRFLRISRRSLSEFRKRGLIRGVKLGSVLLFRRADLEASLEKLAD